MQAESRHSARLSCRLIGARWEVRGRDQGGYHAHGDPMPVPCKPAPWNNGRLIGQKRPLKPKDVWAIRVRLQLQGRKRDLALFNLAIGSKLRGCDLVRLQVDDVCAGGRMRYRGHRDSEKTGRPVQFEIAEQTRIRRRGRLNSVLRRNHGSDPGIPAMQPCNTPILVNLAFLGKMPSVLGDNCVHGP